MGINAAGQHQQPGGIVQLHIFPVSCDQWPQSRHLESEYRHIVIHRRNNATTLNQYLSHQNP
jgi:hypothetical protein